MGYGLRYYLFKDDGEIQRISNVMFNSFFKDDVHIPKFANQKLKLASVILELENRVPISILETHGMILSFDEHGSPSKSTEQIIRNALNSIPSFQDEPGVIPIHTQIAKNERKKFEWNIGKNELDLIAKDIWKKRKKRSKKIICISKNTAENHGNTEEIEMKDDNNKFIENHNNFDKLKEAIRKIIHLIEYAEDSFLEYAFRSVSTHAIPKSETERERLLWQGVKAALQSERERGKRWKAGDGQWVAAIYLFKWDDWKQQSAKSEIIEHTLCDGKKAAVTAARKLTVKHSMKVGELSYVEPSVMPLDDWNEIHGPEKSNDDDID
ncbi:MAG: hypothetical protein HY795_15750 [Desulfovibrio sp.]|nr:hypothetical protein [Desulfovibrio sp.]MBI4958724.1 hypothetical protein [Desulfovibrio sp.]